MVTFQGHGIFTLQFSVWSYRLRSLNDFFKEFTQMLPSMRRCADPMTQLCTFKVRSHLKVMEFTHQFCVRSISTEPFEQFSLNFTQLFLSVRRCAEPMNQLRSLKVKVTLQCYGILQRGLGCPLNCCLVQIMFLVSKMAFLCVLETSYLVFSVTWCLFYLLCTIGSSLVKMAPSPGSHVLYCHMVSH